jgi:DEAD/DEAH box helicase domain-containing protein
VDHYVVFDLETRKLAHEVGGWANVPLMGLSVGVAYSNREGFITFYEEDVNDLVALLKSSDLVVGFNHVGFDYKVLSAYTDYDFHELNNLDMLVEVKKVLGFRLKLQSLAEATLKEGKTADGLIAAQWFREGKLDLVEKYCRDDVRITRDLYLFAAQNGRVLYRNKKGTVITIPVDWPRPLDLAPGEAVSSHP